MFSSGQRRTDNVYDVDDTFYSRNTTKTRTMFMSFFLLHINKVTCNKYSFIETFILFYFRKTRKLQNWYPNTDQKNGRLSLGISRAGQGNNAGEMIDLIKFDRLLTDLTKRGGMLLYSDLSRMIFKVIYLFEYLDLLSRSNHTIFVISRVDSS